MDYRRLKILTLSVLFILQPPMQPIKHNAEV